MTKQEIITQCTAQVEEKLNRLRSTMQELRHTNAENTKSTAGDKHDTARAMVHLEQEKLGNQIMVEEQILHDLQRMDGNEYTQVQFGTVVTTNKGIYLVGAACGKVVTSDTTLFGISMQSPLARALLGRKQTESAIVNGNKFLIRSIC